MGRRLVSAIALCLFLLAPRLAAAQDAERITVSHPNATTTAWRIFAPNVRQRETYYRQIVFHRGDTIEIYADGCVQTGGRGRTWKDYVNPQGPSAPTLYSGTVYIPGVIPLGADGFQRIGGFIRERLTVPDVLPPTIKDSDLVLALGYQDNDYSDNGYYAHDDGTGDQCKNKGAAVVAVDIISGGGAPATAWTPSSRPFDLVWRVDGIDANGLPVNPRWAAQVATNGLLPDFSAACGPAFSWNYGHHGMDEDTGKLAALCTSQQPTADFSGSAWTEPGGLCHPQPMSGHLNWAYATFGGSLFWTDYSGGWPHDGDIDMNLVVNGDASQTPLNNGALGLEFNKSETLDNFGTAFWKTLRNTIENGSDADVAKILDGNFALVTGLVGIDGVHGGYTEIHPVTSMAICVAGCTVVKTGAADPPVIYGADQTWVFFVANFGAEGECSQAEHYWDGLSDKGQNPWYFLSLPWHPGATAVHTVSHAVLTDTPALKTADAKRWRNWTYVGFQFPPAGPSGQHQLDGVVTLHYDVPAGGMKPLAAPRVTARGHLDENADFAALETAIRDPAKRARLTVVVASSTPPPVLARPHALRAELVVNPDADRALATLTPERGAQPKRDRAEIDPARARIRSDFYLSVAPLLRGGVALKDPGPLEVETAPK